MKDEDLFSIYRLASDPHLDACLETLRADASGDSCSEEIRELSKHWDRIKTEIQAALIKGKYRLGECDKAPGDDAWVGRWSAKDALVIRALSRLLSEAAERMENQGASPDLDLNKGRATTQPQVQDDTLAFAHIYEALTRVSRDKVLLELVRQFFTRLSQANSKYASDESEESGEAKWPGI